MPAMHDDGAGEPAAQAPAATTEGAAWTPAATASIEATAPVVQAPVQAPAGAPAAAAAPRPVARIEPFVLPLSDLQALAAQAGLEWVGSDAEKVASAQAAIAATPPAIHVPREPRPPVVLDEGPLVLVETRKDLSQLKLPFDQSAA